MVSNTRRRQLVLSFWMPIVFFMLIADILYVVFSVLFPTRQSVQDEAARGSNHDIWATIFHAPILFLYSGLIAGAIISSFSRGLVAVQKALLVWIVLWSLDGLYFSLVPEYELGRIDVLKSLVFAIITSALLLLQTRTTRVGG